MVEEIERLGLPGKAGQTHEMGAARNPRPGRRPAPAPPPRRRRRPWRPPAPAAGPRCTPALPRAPGTPLSGCRGGTMKRDVNRRPTGGWNSGRRHIRTSESEVRKIPTPSRRRDSESLWISDGLVPSESNPQWSGCSAYTMASSYSASASQSQSEFVIWHHTGRHPWAEGNSSLSNALLETSKLNSPGMSTRGYDSTQ